MGLDIKIKCLPWPEAKLRLFDSFSKPLSVVLNLENSFLSVVDTFFEVTLKRVNQKVFIFTQGMPMQVPTGI